ncbi:MAG: FxsA family protein [Acidimicrobiia bacterium]|nr:FxsA family protein [Acidimicrobiia bacterium]
MFIVLLLVLLGIPVAEIFFIIRVARDLGIAETIGLLVAVTLAGAWLVRRSGLGVLRQIQERLARGEIPGKELVDGLLILVGGLLMLTPGFLTDAVGLLLLVPPTRLALRALLIRRYSKRIRIAGWKAGPGASGFSGFGAGGRRHGAGGFGSGSDTEPGRGDVRDVREPRQLRKGRRRRTEPDED